VVWRQIIAELELVPHPEGGWYRELYRSGQSVDTALGPRSALTTIYYLLQSGQHSRWHVVDADEVWHFYAGAPLELLTYDPRRATLGRRMLTSAGSGGAPVGIVAAGIWQAARCLGDYSLLGCTVGPGFQFSGFQLVASLPGHGEHFLGALQPLRDLL
jgi:predicted cupin superfamily sugar epimerase